MKILVTGSNGLAGKALQRLAPAFDASSTFVFATRKDADMEDAAQVDALIQLHQPNAVVHLAARVGGLFYNLSSNAEMYRANCVINTNVIEACVRHKVDTCFIILSTCIFPDVFSRFDESDLHRGPPHWSNYGYAVAKRYAQVLATKYMEQDKCHTKFHFLAPTNLYGPEDNFNTEASHVVPALLLKAHHLYASESEQALFVQGDGKPLRQFMFIDDLANVILRLLHSEQPIPRTLIVAPSEEHSIKHLAETILKETNISANGIVLSGAASANGQMRKYAMNNLLMSLPCMQGFSFTPLDKGIRATVEWMRSPAFTAARR